MCVGVCVRLCFYFSIFKFKCACQTLRVNVRAFVHGCVCVCAYMCVPVCLPKSESIISSILTIIPLLPFPLIPTIGVFVYDADTQCPTLQDHQNPALLNLNWFMSEYLFPHVKKRSCYEARVRTERPMAFPS